VISLPRLARVYRFTSTLLPSPSNLKIQQLCWSKSWSRLQFCDNIMSNQVCSKKEQRRQADWFPVATPNWGGITGSVESFESSLTVNSWIAGSNIANVTHLIINQVIDHLSHFVCAWNTRGAVGEFNQCKITLCKWYVGLKTIFQIPQNLQS
jgi:hypothetical protein